jgi:hypothetical protein
MNFKDAQLKIGGLFPNVSLISYQYNKRVFSNSNTEIRCGAIVVMNNSRDAEGFWSSTWEGVIKKIEIYLVPNDPPTDEGEPNDDE